MSKVPDAVQKHLAALAAEAAEKAVASRMAAAPAPAAPAVATKSTSAMTPSQALGMRVKSAYVSQYGAGDGRLTAAQRDFITKAGANAGTNASGGALIQPAFADEVIPVLRERSVLIKAGVKLYTYDSPNLNIGRLNQGVTLGWVAEGGAPAGSTVQTDAVILGSKHLAGYIQASNQMLRQPTLDSAGVLADDVLSAIASEVDAKFLVGDGTGNAPTGITGQLDPAQTFPITATPDNAKIKKDLAKAMRLVRQSKLQFEGNSPAWFMPALEFFNLMSLRDTGGNLFPSLEQAQPTLYGYPVYVTEALSNQIVFALAAQVAYGVSFGPNVGMGLNGTDLVSDSTTIFGRFIGDVKVRYNKCASVITGTNAW